MQPRMRLLTRLLMLMRPWVQMPIAIMLYAVYATARYVVAVPPRPQLPGEQESA